MIYTVAHHYSIAITISVTITITSIIIISTAFLQGQSMYVRQAFLATLPLLNIASTFELQTVRLASRVIHGLKVLE